MGSFFSSIGHGLLTLALPALGTILSALAVSFVQKKAQQAGIELTQAQSDRLKSVVTDAVQAVEEKAGRAEAAGTPMSPEVKRSSALALVAAHPTLVTGDVQTMIDTVLPEVRAKLASALPPIMLGRVPPQAL